jgi:hypothetical protein
MDFLQNQMWQSEDRRVREKGEKVERQRLAKLALRRGATGCRYSR